MQYGRYKILSQLGQGGMAAVYLAEDPALGRLVAIKVIQSHLTTDPGLLQRFSTEAKTIASLRNSNIVEIFDFGIQDGQQYIVMEYMDGQTLQYICGLQQGRPLPEEVAASMICQAAEGLVAAEKKGVIHRDIKPENLMINSEGYLKIADFGIAHLSNEQSMTATGAVLGSPNFMSPEQVEGKRPTHQTDMWALGGILYYCLAGKLPFTGPTITSTLRNICDKDLLPLVELASESSEIFQKLTHKLLEKEPEDRGDGAKWVASELRLFLSQKGVTDLQDTTRNFIKDMEIPQSATMVESTPPPGTSSSKIPLTPGARMDMGTATPTGMPGMTTPSQSGISGPIPTPSGSAYGQVPGGTTTFQNTGFKNPLVWVGILLVIAIVGVGGIFLSKGSGDKKEGPKSLVSKVILETNQLKLTPGQKQKLGVTILPPEAPQELEWSSTNESIVSVADGMVSAKALGTAIVLVKSKDNPEKDAICRVTVSKKPPPPPKPKVVAKKDPPKKKAPVRKKTTPKKVAKPKPKPKPKPVKKDPPASKKAQLKILSSPPFATIRVNGSAWGETPMNRFREVPAGRVRVELVHRLYPPLDTILRLGTGSKKQIKFKLN